MTLDEIYAKVPRIACKGLCSGYCGVITLQSEELTRMQAAAPIPSVTVESSRGSCPALTAKKRCAVYDARPLICRLWGTVKALRCPHGCRPKRWLSDAEARSLIDAAKDASPVQRALHSDVDAMLRSKVTD